MALSLMIDDLFFVGILRIPFNESVWARNSFASHLCLEMKSLYYVYHEMICANRDL